jgi:hypothetical protein
MQDVRLCLLIFFLKITQFWSKIGSKSVLCLKTAWDRKSYKRSVRSPISLSNVILHFDEEKANTVYIGLCNWSLSSRVVELASLRYSP